MPSFSHVARRIGRFVSLLSLACHLCVHAATDPNALLVNQARAHLAQLESQGGLSGVVLMARNGQPIMLQAYGYSNLADRVRNRVDTKFNMASMGKMFTAVAILQLVESGKISLGEKVGHYLPDFPNQRVRDEVTIEQLLTHTSGMGNFWEQLADKPKERYVAVADYVPLFADQPLQFDPGHGFAYSNNGYTVLGLVIEAASGQSYFDYVREKIYRRCGMTDTDAIELDDPVPNLATGYSRSSDRPGRIVSNLYTNTFKGGPAGGSYTTARDLLKFADALMRYELLTPADTELLTRGKVDYGKRRYAYGFTEETINGHRLIGHGGGNAGIADELMIFPDLGFAAVVLTNGDVENFWDVQAFVKRALLGPSSETDAFEFTRALIAETVAQGYDAAARRLQGRHDHPAIRSGLMEQIGYRLLWQSRIVEATAVFRLYALARPDDEYAYLGLGTACERSGDASCAAKAFEAYLGFEPDDRRIADRLRKLRLPKIDAPAASNAK